MKLKEKFPKLQSKNFSLTRDFFQPILEKSALTFSRPKGQSFHVIRDLNNTTTSSFPYKKPEKSFLENLKTPNFSIKSDQNPNEINKKLLELKKSLRKLELLLKKAEMKRLEVFLIHISALMENINKDFAEKSVLLESQFPLYEKFLDFQISFYNLFREISLDLILKSRFFQKNEDVIREKEKIYELNKEKVASKASIKEKSEKDTDSEVFILKLENARLQKAFEDLNKRTEFFSNEGLKNQKNEAFSEKKDSPKLKSMESLIFNNLRNKEEKPLEGNNQNFSEEREKDFEKVLFSKQQIIQNSKIMISKLEKENSEQRVTIDSLKQGLEELQAQNHHISLESQRFYETSLMQYEENCSFRRKCEEMGVFSRKLKEKIELLNAKVVKLTGNRIENPENPGEKDFNLDLSLFSIIRKSLQEKDFKKPKKSPLLSLYNKEEIVRNKEKVAKLTLRTGLSNQEEAFEEDFSRFTLTKPVFFSFLEHKFLSYSNEIHAERPNRISSALLATIRGILDSKYLEFRYEKDWKLIRKFPESVYSWLGNSQAISGLKQVVFLNKQEKNHADDFRIMFLIDITNPKLQKLWEVVTFKDFLEEKSQLDELYFYLHCRNLLLKGLETADMSFFQDLIHYVSLNRCFEVLENVFLSFEKPVLDFIRNKLKEKGGKMTLNGLLIDSAYALRLFLEFYKTEKTKKMSLIKDLFLSFHSFEVPNVNALSVSYQSFKKVIEAFNEFSEAEIPDFYRKVWNFGNGAVNYESFLAIAEEENFFLRTLKLKSQMPIPLKLDFEKNIDKSEEMAWEAIEMMNFYENRHEEFEFLEKSLENHGCLEIFQSLAYYKRLVLGKFQISSEEIKTQEILEFFLNWMIEVLKSLKVVAFSLNAEENIRKLVVMEGVKFIGNLLEGVRRFSEEKKKNWEEERNRNARKLQGFFKKKVSKWYTLLNSLLGPKVKKVANYKKKE